MAPNLEINTRIYRKYIAEANKLYNEREDVRTFTELLLSLFTIIIFGIFAIRPTLVTISKLTKELEDKKQLVATLNLKIDHLGTAQELLAKNRNKISTLDLAIPTQPVIQSYVRQLQGVALNNNLNIVGMNFGTAPLVDKSLGLPPGTNKVPITKPIEFGEQDIDFSISVSGEFNSLADFVSQIENLRRPFGHIQTSIDLSQSVEGDKIVLTIKGIVPYIQKL